MMNWRSLLFVAANDYARIDKIATRGADAVILDLEDAVAPDDKVAARDGIAQVVDRIVPTLPIVVRINAGWLDAFADLSVAVRPGVAAIMVPKVEDAGRVIALAAIIAELAASRSLTAIPAIVALIESAEGLAQIDAIADVPQLIALALGTEDFAFSIGVDPSRDLLSLPCRQVALAAARRGLSAYAIPASIGIIKDEAAWRSAIVEARAFGVTGALCIHPRQVQIANTEFAGDTAKIEQARALLEAWDHAGKPAVFEHDGKMVDRPVLLSAMRAAAVTIEHNLEDA